MKNFTHSLSIFGIVITMIVSSLCHTALAIPMPMTYTHQQITNSFARRTGLEPTVSNILYLIENSEASGVHANQDGFFDSQTAVRWNKISLLPYLVTPEDSNSVVKVLHACITNNSDNAKAQYYCAKALINTTFDVDGGIELLQKIVNMTNAQHSVRLLSASHLMRNGILAGYDLMLKTFASGNETTRFYEIAPAMDLLRWYLYYVDTQRRLNEQDGQGEDVLVTTQEGEPIDLNAVAQIIMNNTALPFGTRLSAARMCVDFDILVGYDLMREAFASDNRQWHDQAEKLFLGYVSYMRGHSERGDTTPLYTLDGTPIDLEELAQHMTHEIVNPSVQRIINRY